MDLYDQAQKNNQPQSSDVPDLSSLMSPPQDNQPDLSQPPPPQIEPISALDVPVTPPISNQPAEPMPPIEPIQQDVSPLPTPTPPVSSESVSMPTPEEVKHTDISLQDSLSSPPDINNTPKEDASKPNTLPDDSNVQTFMHMSDIPKDNASAIPVSQPTSSTPPNHPTSPLIDPPLPPNAPPPPPSAAGPSKKFTMGRGILFAGIALLLLTLPVIGFFVSQRNTEIADTRSRAEFGCPNGQIACGGCLASRGCMPWDGQKTCNQLIEEQCQQQGCAGDGVYAGNQQCCPGLYLCDNGRCGTSCIAPNPTAVPTPLPGNSPVPTITPICGRAGYACCSSSPRCPGSLTCIQGVCRNPIATQAPNPTNCSIAGDTCSDSNKCCNGLVCQGEVGNKKCEQPATAPDAQCGGTPGSCGRLIAFHCNGDFQSGTPGSGCFENPKYIENNDAAGWAEARAHVAGCGQIDVVCKSGPNQNNLCGDFEITKTNCAPIQSTPVPTNPPLAQCQNLKIYRDGVVVRTNQYGSLRGGQKITFAVVASQGNRARFFINNAVPIESTTKNDKDEITLEYTIPSSNQPRTFVVQAEVRIDGVWR